MTAQPGIRQLVIVLGDQLDPRSAAFDSFDAASDAVWMCEASEESTHVWSSRQRIVLFLAAMRHFAAGLRERGLPLIYHALPDSGPATTLAQMLGQTLAGHAVQRIVLMQPGDWRVQQALLQAAAQAGVPVALREDRHFMCSRAQFATHAGARKQLRMEYFYREMRRRHAVLMDGDSAIAQPLGGEWNYDSDNRGSFGRQGPGLVTPPLRFEPDAMTREVMALVSRRFADHPGRIATFGWPVTLEQALLVLADFILHRLEHFGRWQDAMWSGQPWLYHAQIASALNLKLLDPREAITAAEAAHRAGRVRRPDGEQALHRQRPVHRSHERSLPGLPLRPGAAQRRARLPLHHAVLGLPGAARGAAGAQPADGLAGEEPGPAG